MINLDRILANTNLDPDELAIKLFPNNKYPKVALKRVIDGTALLDSEQIIALSNLTNIPIPDLFKDTWKSQSSNGQITFTKNGYKVVLDNNIGITRIFKISETTPFHESVLHTGSVKLNEYLAIVDDIIEKHKLKQ